MSVGQSDDVIESVGITKIVMGTVVRQSICPILRHRPRPIRSSRRQRIVNGILGKRVENSCGVGEIDRRSIGTIDIGDLLNVNEGITVKDRKSTRLNSSHLGISYAV